MIKKLFTDKQDNKTLSLIRQIIVKKCIIGFAVVYKKVIILKKTLIQIYIIIKNKIKATLKLTLNYIV